MGICFNSYFLHIDWRTGLTGGESSTAVANTERKTTQKDIPVPESEVCLDWDDSSSEVQADEYVSSSEDECVEPTPKKRRVDSFDDFQQCLKSQVENKTILGEKDT